MAEERRLQKANFLIREKLAEIINKEIEFPQGIFVTVTRVESSHDLYYADVFISVFPKKEKEALTLLERKLPYLQSILNKQLKMRPIPRLRFKIDTEEKNRERIEKLLTMVEKENNDQYNGVQ